jgi:hypothetical protein
MTDIINLNQMRKAKSKAEKDKQATANRAKFGRSKDEIKKEKQQADKAKRLLDGHKREKDDQ